MAGFFTKVTGEATAQQASTNLLRAVNSIITRIEAAVDPAMKAVGAEVLKEAIPLTPMKTGALRASGKYRTTRSIQGVELVVSFGGPSISFSGNVDYAIERHENPARVYTTPGTTWKYLQIGGETVAYNSALRIIARSLTNSLRGSS